MRLQVTTSKSKFSRRHILAGTAIVSAAILSGLSPAFSQAVPYEIMTAAEAHEAASTGDVILVDIRTPEEWTETGIGEGAIALDMRTESFVPTLVQLRKTYPELPIAMICRTGNRSDYVTNALAKQGFPNLIDVKEGMAGGRNGNGWLNHGLPTYPGTSQQIEIRLGSLLTE